ncbi:hypothetical protein HK103_002777 [Boothiomyces macroporosus]|uniref:Uncharacterized protein n=1 Tax=Boothiomyces macroporosus TaxID=261099 RepID=A0AAD5UMS4_9FUNG|nr:hypothetical protein HK103_002750 [Boothiomyces macroporosus]KAJ3262362.1 hypothetical protein HK103_002777 [Boothiomyces macroporosus]
MNNAFKMQQIIHRDTDMLQQIMHTHFVFLERVVSDLSHRINDLQEQLNIERKERLEYQSKNPETPNVKLDNYQKQNDNRDELNLLDQKIQILHQNAYSQNDTIAQLTDVVNTNKAYLQDLLSSHKQTIETANATIMKNYETFQTKLTGELNSFKVDIEEAIKTKFKEVELFNVMVIKNQEESNSRFLELEKSLIAKIELDVQDSRIHFRNELELSNQSRRHEQTSIIGVISTMKHSITGMRQEHKLFEQKLIQQVNSKIIQFESDIRNEIKKVSRPLIVT